MFGPPYYGQDSAEALDFAAAADPDRERFPARPISDHIAHQPPYPYFHPPPFPYGPPHPHWPPPQQLPPPPPVDVYSLDYWPQMPKTVDAAPSAARRHVDHRPDGPSRRPSSAGLPPMVKSPSLSASSADRSSNSSGPPHVPPSPPEHGGTHYQRMSYQDEQLVARYAPPHQGRENGAPPSNYGGGHQYGPPQQQRYGYYNSSPQHYNGGAPPPPPSNADASRNNYAAPPAANGTAPFQIVHTDDAATKLSDRVRRRCFNCCTTETSTWRRSSLNPGKVLCNKCGLFERTHSRPRPEQFPHKRGPVAGAPKTPKPANATGPATTTASAPPPPPPPQVVSAQPVAPPPPHHYDHPSLAPLRSRAESQHQSPPRADTHAAIKSLLNSPDTPRASLPSMKTHHSPPHHSVDLSPNSRVTAAPTAA